MKDKKSTFNESAKQRIKALFTEKFKQRQPEVDWQSLPDQAAHWQFLEDEAEIFLITLQNWGLSIPEFEQFNPPKQQKRRETIKSMGSALLRCVNQFAELDSGARGFVCFLGVEEIASTIGEPNIFPDDVRSSLFVHAHKDDVIKELRAFAKGVLKAADELPEKPESPIELLMALWIERLFWEQGFEFTTSHTSFAAECLRSVLALGGIHKDRVDYWLTEARNHEDSMASMMTRLQKTNEKLH